jgi:VIT1/CCC1 family predicted Fe2+/Mn2+ transporter
MNYSLSDIPDKAEREKSLKLVKNLFALLLLHKEISRSNIVSAVVRGTTSFLASILPIITYFALQIPSNIVASLLVGGSE